MVKKRFGIIFIACGLFLLSITCLTEVIPNCLDKNIGDAVSNFLGFIFYVILGVGILRFNNKIRLITVIYIIYTALAGPMGLIYGSFIVDKQLHQEVLKRYGVFVEIYPWLVILPISFFYLCCVVYLTHPSVKAMFRTGP